MCPTCALSYAARVGLRSNDSDPRHAQGESARVRPLLRPAATSEGRVLSSAHCPHCQTRRFFSRGDIDRRALQSAPPPSATGVRGAPPKPWNFGVPTREKARRGTSSRGLGLKLECDQRVRGAALPLARERVNLRRVRVRRARAPAAAWSSSLWTLPPPGPAGPACGVRLYRN